MLKGVNDSAADAKDLVRLLKGIPAKINLIPFNPWPGTRYECSDWDQIEKFSEIVFNAGYASPVRTRPAQERDREAVGARAPGVARDGHDGLGAHEYQSGAESGSCLNFQTFALSANSQDNVGDNIPPSSPVVAVLRGVVIPHCFVQFFFGNALPCNILPERKKAGFADWVLRGDAIKLATLQVFFFDSPIRAHSAVGFGSPSHSPIPPMIEGRQMATAVEDFNRSAWWMTSKSSCDYGKRTRSGFRHLWCAFNACRSAHYCGGHGGYCWCGQGRCADVARRSE
jgi:hypothetical protein